MADARAQVILSNPATVARWVHGKLLGFFVSQRGIEANLEKIKAIEKIEAPGRIKDVRRLTGCVAAMSRFISKSARALPFFKTLKKAGPMEWTPKGRGGPAGFEEVPLLYDNTICA